jgi:hypothetical protein
MKKFKLKKNVAYSILKFREVISNLVHSYVTNLSICNNKKLFHDKFYTSEDVLWYIRWDFSKRFEEEEMKHENF